MAINSQALNASEENQNTQSNRLRLLSRFAFFDGLGYDAVAAGRLTNRFQNKPKVQALVKAMTAPLNLLEEELLQMRDQLFIDGAIGKQLDGAGYIVGESRLGRDDDEYRDAIKFKIFVNTSTATPEDLIKGLRFLTAPDDVQYIEQYPATAILFTSGAKIPTGLQKVIQSLSPAAISTVPIAVSYAHARPLRFGRSAPPAELFVNNDADYLVANNADLQISTSNVASAARFGGLVASDLDVGGFMLDVGIGSLAINSANFDFPLESGTHLTGVFQ